MCLEFPDHPRESSPRRSTYKTKPGFRARFLEIFRDRSMPAHAEIGMKISGPFLSIEDPDTFFFMRDFPDIASREPMKARF